MNEKSTKSQQKRNFSSKKGFLEKKSLKKFIEKILPEKTAKPKKNEKVIFSRK